MFFKPSYAYLTGIIIVIGVALLIQLPLIQIVSIAGFLGIILGAIFFWRFRVAFALVGVAIMLLLGVMDIEHVIEYAHFDVILFLFGMMTVIGFLEEKGFFEHMLNLLFKYFSRDGRTLVTGLLLLSCMFAALVDEVTSILFITALTLRLTKRYRMDVLPMIIATVMATNVGSSFTVIGNPIGVLIAFEGHLTFLDFIRWATPVGLAVLGLTIAIVWIYWKPYIKTLDTRMKESKTNPTGKVEISKEVSVGKMKIPWIIFLTTIISLALHHPLETALGLPTNSLLLTFPLLMAGISLLISREKAREIIERRVEWWSLVFFIFFFTSVGTLIYTGLASRIAEGTASVTGGNPIIMLTMITWLAGILSAFMDNILAVATLLSIVHGLEAAGFDAFAAYWGLLFGACYLGNLTMIGSTANIVALGIVERERKLYINFLDWVKPGLVIAIPELALATVLLLIMHV
jgi:Na+/H+ antiporter NhaD/arsenite permease-like protein